MEAAGLLDPPLVQLVRFYRQLARFDLGVSRRIQNSVPVTKVIGSKFVISMRLGWTSLAISVSLGVALGVVQTIFKERFWDHVGTAYTVFVRAVPTWSPNLDPMDSLNERAKVDHIVAEGIINHGLYKDARDRQRKVHQTLREVGLLPEFASRFPHEFSGG